MGKITLVKDGEIIKFSEFMLKMRSSREGLYKCDDRRLRFNSDVTDIIFEDCKFDNYINVSSNKSQNIVFKNCVFDNCNLGVYDANNVVLDSSFEYGHIGIYSTVNSCYMNVHENSIMGKLYVDAPNITITTNNKKQGEVVLLSGYFEGDLVSIQDIFIKNKQSFTVTSNLLQIKNSSIVASTFMNFINNNFIIDKRTILEAKNIEFYSKKDLGLIFKLNNKQGESILVLGEELLEHKQQTISSFISVLKGFSNRLNSINSKEHSDFCENLDSEKEVEFQKISDQIALLYQQQKDLEDEIREEKRNNSKELENRLIKEISYK